MANWQKLFLLMAVMALLLLHSAGVAGQAPATHAAQSFKDLGIVSKTGSSANGVSGDGSVVVGSFEDASGVEHAFRWTAGKGVEDLGTMGGRKARAEAISADGLVVVGIVFYANNNDGHAFRWTAAKGVEDLGTMGGVGGVEQRRLCGWFGGGGVFYR